MKSNRCGSNHLASSIRFQVFEALFEETVEHKFKWNHTKCINNRTTIKVFYVISKDETKKTIQRSRLKQKWTKIPKRLLITLPALNIPKIPDLFLCLMADIVPLLVSDLNPEPDKLMVLLIPPPVLESEPMLLPFFTTLKSSNGISSGCGNPDLNFSTTNRTSCWIKTSISHD